MQELEYELMDVRSMLGESVSASRDYTIPGSIRGEAAYRSRKLGKRLDQIKRELKQGD